MYLNHKILVLFGICSTITACGPNEYYVPVTNQIGNAQSLSKITDTIRVIIPYNYPSSVKIARSNNSNWLMYANNARYTIISKVDTEDRLQALGYHVVDTGFHPKNDGHPNVIALVESGEDESKAHNVVRTWTEPSYTDTMGNPTAWDTKAVTSTMKHIDYKVTLVRPNENNNPLLKCITDNNFSTGFCIAPEHPDNYKVIFEGQGSNDTNLTSPADIVNHITTAVWHDYPNMMGQYKVFLYSQPHPEVIRVEPDSPKKGS